jgi:co-chaperonin GroES (HSP10)
MMRVLHDNVLVTEVKNEKETTTEGGIILTTDVSTGHKPALVIAVGEGVDLSPRDKVYLDWSKAIAVEVDGLKCAVIKYEDIKLVV